MYTKENVRHPFCSHIFQLLLSALRCSVCPLQCTPSAHLGQRGPLLRRRFGPSIYSSFVLWTADALVHLVTRYSASLFSMLPHHALGLNLHGILILPHRLKILRAPRMLQSPLFPQCDELRRRDKTTRQAVIVDGLAPYPTRGRWGQGEVAERDRGEIPELAVCG